MIKRIIILLSIIFFSSCVSTKSFGPNSLRRTHSGYNQAIIKSLDKQMLLNLVRLRYRDSVYFLQVGSVTASFSVSGGAGMQSNLNLATDGNVLSPFANLSYSQSPTVSYQPLQGEDFLKSVLSPISIESLLAMSRSGWSLKRVLDVGIERINDIENAPTASGPTPIAGPRFEEFNDFSEFLYALDKEGLIEIGRGEESKLFLLIKSGSDLVSEVAGLRRLLNLSQDQNQFELNSNFFDKKENQLNLRTRSILGIMFYLSQNIDIPAEHKEAGLVTITKPSSTKGVEFDWGQTPAGKLFAIRTSKSRPPNAYIRIFYRGYWFYIKDNDLQSKSTFMFLSQLFSLQAGQIEYTQPALTIPVGGR